MEPEPTMETRPPALVDAIVRALIPPACRESVIGDLWERYTTPGRYLGDAIRTLPFLVVSRLRRTTNASMSAVVFLMLYASFQQSVLRWPSGAVPAAAVLLTFLLRDVYRDAAITPARRTLGDAIGIVTAAFISQLALAWLRPELMLGRWGVAVGGITCTLLLYARFMTPQPEAHQASSTGGPRLSLDELRREIQFVSRSARSTRLVETGAGVLVIAASLAGVLWAPRAEVKAGLALLLAGAVFVIVYLHRHAMRPIAMDRPFAETRHAFRTELARGEWLLRRVWLWYLLPLMIGPAVLLGGAMLSRPNAIVSVAAVLATMAVMTLLIHRMNRAAARRLAQRIAALDDTDERL